MSFVKIVETSQHPPRGGAFQTRRRLFSGTSLPSTKSLRIAELSLWRWLPRRRLDGWMSIAIGLQDYTCPKSAWTSKTHQTYLKSTRWCKICGLCISGIAACVAFIKNISVHGCIILKQKNPFLASLLVTFLGWRKRDPNSKVDSWKLVTSIAWFYSYPNEGGTVDGQNPKQPPGMLKTPINKWDN